MKNENEIMHPPEDIDSVISRCLAGESRPGDREVMDEWLSVPCNREEFDTLKSYWDARVESTCVPAIPSMITPPDEQKTPHTLSVWKGYRPKISRVATLTGACAAALLAGIFIGGQTGRKTGSTVTYITGSSHTGFELPDGSQVYLNRDSKLTLGEGFSRTDRKLKLEGEGYFEVARDMDLPMTVDLGQAEVLVTGTVFNIKNRKNDPVTVSLIEGSVVFSTSEQKVALKPDNQLLYTRKTGEITVGRFDADILTAWKDGLVKYRSLSFRELMSLISERYGVRIMLGETTSQEATYTGTFDAAMHVEQVFEVLAKTIPFSWSMSNEDIYEITSR